MPMTIFEFLKDLNDTAKERLKTPISGAFFFSFLLYNWRPIFLLLFSEASIEDKIIVINREHYNWENLLYPILLALIYTIVVPMLSVIIEKVLFSTKKARIKGIYYSKGIEINEKITFAVKENELKDALSGNKEKQEYLDQISNLNGVIEQMKETHEQISIADKNTINVLNSKLKEINSETKELYRFSDDPTIEQYNPKEFDERASDIFNRLSKEDKEDFITLRDSNGKINLEKLRDSKRSLFIAYKLIQKDIQGNWLISDRGIYVYNRIMKEAEKQKN